MLIYGCAVGKFLGAKLKSLKNNILMQRVDRLFLIQANIGKYGEGFFTKCNRACSNSLKNS
jgi:hypothetical protein